MPPPVPDPAPQPVDSAEIAEVLVPTVTIVGSVRDLGTRVPLAGAQVSIAELGLATTSDATGSYSIEGLPAGSLSVAARRTGYLPRNELIIAEAGGTVELDLMLRGPPSALEPDVELTDGQWAVTDRAGAEATLDRPVAVISGLWIESIARPATGTRPRVRVAHLVDSGERITLVVARSGPAGGTAQPRVTALRIIPPTEAYPITTGTASFGGLLVTAKTTLPAESLRALLQQLVEADSG